MNKIDKIGRRLMREYPNMVGYSKGLRKRIRKGKVVDEEVIQVHVNKKKPLIELRALEVLPRDVDGFPIDVVEKEEYRFLKLPQQGVVRPLKAGISIGNRDITAGTLCDFMDKLTSPDKGVAFITSNGHIIADDPLSSDVMMKDILQPGDADGGVEVVATYYWHQQLYPESGIPSECVISNGVARSLNVMASVLNRQSRFSALVTKDNHLDFGVALPKEHIEWVLEHFDVVFDPNRFQFAGIGFAGSNVSSLGCWHNYIKEAGYWPSRYDAAEVFVNDIVHFTGRTSGHKAGFITDPSIVARIAFGLGQYLIFDNIFSMSPMLEPGDSGSGIYKELTP